MSIGNRIKDMRQRSGLSVDELALRLGKNRATVYRYENGDIENLPVSVLEPLAKVLETTPEYLMGWTDNPARIVPDEEAEKTVPPGFLPLPHTVKKPIVGQVACGEPILAEQNIEDYADVPDNIRCDFCLICRGDSMVDAGIQDGDIVYIRIQPEVEDGEIAAVRIGSEATLKRVYYDGKSITLMPANAAYRPKTYTGIDLEDIQIEGKAVGFTHWF